MNLWERLSRLNRRQIEKLFGDEEVDRILTEGSTYEITLPDQVQLSSNLFRLALPDAQVSIIEDDASVRQMHFVCSSCETICRHVGAALSLILEEKTALGLATEPPDDIEPLELTEDELIARELRRRIDRAANERLNLKIATKEKLWSDYVVTSHESGKSYRVALRGWERGESFCTCPDFRKNTLGTCKHILFTITRVRSLFPSWEKAAPYRPEQIQIHVLYGNDIELRLQTPEGINQNAVKHLKPFLNRPISDIGGLMSAVSRSIAQGTDIQIFPDAEQYITMQLHRLKLAELVTHIRRDPAGHPLRIGLLKTELLPYQLDGIAFAAGTGRIVLADDMGLGKTIQGIGIAELLARECAITRTLIVCPASVKSQWRNEINKFCDRTAQIVVGSSSERFNHYHNGAFFTICNYEQVLRDVQAIEQIAWDLIILDEGQRIKNWEAKTTRTVKALRSRYAVVLSGTPLENRLEELYSVMEFIDDRRLGPDFRFEHRHRVEDGKGRVTGYKNLDILREMLKPVMLRRTRAEVMKQLPPRTTEIVRITPTGEQMEIHAAHSNIIAQIVRKPYLTEMDLLRLQKSLLACRMVADSTVLVNKEEPGYSTKLERLAELLPQLASEKGRKIILFSEWTTMLGLIEKQILKPQGINYVRLDGSVPQKKRQMLVNRFQTDPECIFFIATNAGSMGLNLQAANTVVNVDLPWNPAILEQRIGRAHRMGQKRPVQVYLFVTEETIEENMLRTLALKKDLANAALDPDSDVMKVDLKAGIDELKKRLELLLAQKPAAPIDESEERRVSEEAAHLARRHAIEEAGGKMIVAAFSFLKAFMPAQQNPAPEMVEKITISLNNCVTKEEDGSVTMKLRLADSSAIEELAKVMAAFTAAATERP